MQQENLTFRSGPCQKSHIGETGRGLSTRLKEQKRDVRNHNRSNALVNHIEKCESLPNWDGTEIIEIGISKSITALEAAHIHLQNTVNEKPGFFTWPKSGAKMALSNTRKQKQ